MDPTPRPSPGPTGLTDGFGDGSPLARLYDRDARIVLLGVGHGNNTALAPG